MDEKTINMIKYLKSYGMNWSSLKEAAIRFMMNYSGCDREVYTDEVINRILLEVFGDFLDHVDKPSFQIFQISEYLRMYDLAQQVGVCETKKDIYDAICNCLYMVQVRDDNAHYVNGFTEKDWAQFN